MKNHLHPSEYGFQSEENKQFFHSILASAPHVIYGCFTFQDKADEHQADRSFRDAIKNFSSRWRYRENIGWIRAMEFKLSGCSDYGVGLHYHFVLFSHARINAGVFESFWSRFVGNAKCEPYDFNKDGIGYMLKMTGQPNCDWTFSDNLYLFLPGYQPINKHQRRVMKRQAERAKLRAA